MRDELGRREQNLGQQMRALIAREVESKVRASFGSHLILLFSLTESGSAPVFFHLCRLLTTENADASGWARRRHVPRQQFVDAVDWMVSDPLEH